MTPKRLEQMRIVSRNHYLKNKENILIRQHVRWLEKKEELNIKASIYAKKNVIALREANKEYLRLNPWMKHYKSASQRCSLKNHVSWKNYGGRRIKFLLTATQIKKLWFRDKAYNLHRPSIDRKDNEGHYQYSNCQFIEFVDNCKKPKRTRNG